MYGFDEYDTYYRSPQGALPSGTTLRLRLLAARGHAGAVGAVVTPDGGAPGMTAMRWTGMKGRYDVFEAEITFQNRDLYWLHFEIQTRQGRQCFDANGIADEPRAPFQVTVYDANLRTPDWIKGGVMYHIFVDRFARGAQAPAVREGAVYREDWGGTPTFLPDEKGIVHNNDFFGGTLSGIIDKLAYLQDMGVTCLYVSPIFEAGSNHKYDTGDYRRIDPGFGDEETFTRLCREARARGMRVLCDGVFNHVGQDSVYFNRYGHYDSIGAYQSKESPYYPWFTFSKWPDEYDCWWGIRLLPSVNEDEPSYRQFITGEDGVLAHWMDKGCGGWRLDVVDELPDSFLYPLCGTVRKKDAEALIIGEVWEDASNKIAYGARRRYLLGGQLDSVMNYPLMDAIIACVREADVRRLADTMAWLTQHYPKPVLDCLMNVLGTHDTMRILTRLGGEAWPETKQEQAQYRLNEQEREAGRHRLMLAAALQFTLPGVPCVYYGDEVGMEGCADPFNRRCYPWGQEDEQLRAWYRKLSHIRAALPAFREGRYELITARGGLLCFARGEGASRVTVAVNVAHKQADVPLDVPCYDWISGAAIHAAWLRGGGVMIATIADNALCSS